MEPKIRLDQRVKKWLWDQLILRFAGAWGDRGDKRVGEDGGIWIEETDTLYISLSDILRDED